MEDIALELDDKSFNYISNLVHKKIGIVLGEHKKNMVYRRLSKRLVDLSLNNFQEYIDYLEKHDSELGSLANAITTNLTSFFREIHHFEFLEEFLPTFFAHNSKLRIWSAGCSSGQEPYSIGMVIKDTVGSQISKYDIKILATDLDTDILQKCVSNTYDITEYEKIPKKYQKYIHKNEQTFSINEDIKSLIKFKQLNLLENWPLQSQFDIIFCRNVVIYFDKPTQKTLYQNFDTHLKDDGYLIIGHSENIVNVYSGFKSIGKTIYRKLEA